AGTAHPADNPERLEYAQMCAVKKQFAAAAGLYVEAFANPPQRVGYRYKADRYNAACSAARIGCRQDANADALSAGERLRWRRQALTWRRDALAFTATQQLATIPRIGPLVALDLQRWQTDPDLAGLRDPAELAKLSAEERAACERLWSDVAALLQRA